MKVLCLLFASFGWCVEECGSCMMKCEWIKQVVPCGYDGYKQLMKGCTISEQDVDKSHRANFTLPYHQVFEKALCNAKKKMQRPSRVIKRAYRVRFYDWTSDKLEHEDTGFNIPDLSDFMAYDKPGKVIVDVTTKGLFILGICPIEQFRYYGPMEVFLPTMATVNNGTIRSNGYYDGDMTVFTSGWNHTECKNPTFEFQAHSSNKLEYVCRGFKSVIPDTEGAKLTKDEIVTGDLTEDDLYAETPPQPLLYAVDQLQEWLDLESVREAQLFTLTLVETCEAKDLKVRIDNTRSVTLLNDAAKRVKGDL